MKYCGGLFGYADLLEAIDNPHHGEHETLLAWAGGSFDPNLFDLEATNRRLQRAK